MRYRWLVPAGLFLAAAYLWGVAAEFQGAVGRYELIGPDFFPKILLAAIMIASLAAVARDVVALRREPAGEETKTFFPADLAIAVLITVAYVAALHVIGFVLATFCFQALILAAVFRVRRWQTVFGVPAVLTTLFFVIFIVLMGVPLPRGSGMFRAFNSLLY